MVESTKIENASFSYKTTISEVNVKTNRMMSTKWTYHKERRFASNDPNAYIRIFVSAADLFDGAFSLRVSLKKRKHFTLEKQRKTAS